ncbi:MULTISPECIES: hypothetical protein [unclassified Mycobacterium]|uniref:hypothetical protein n=1 Tax=unclassified Mycobacterium TaxID=2642494 RepID=UPI0029C7A250|nr:MULTISPECIES: hypothetical protein [unclassified Mycobacterium]
MPRCAQISAVALACALASCSTASPPAPDVDPGMFAGPDLVNPLRGQYENLLTPLFPQADSAHQKYPSWPGTNDVSARIEWRSLQPRDPRTLPPNAADEQKFDFAALDDAIDTAARSGRRFGFRITSFNSCCETSYPNNVDVSVPDWLSTVTDATRQYVHDGVTYVIPDWNNSAYLSYFSELLAALGRRYDRDERVALFEVSGYGDFSENHVTFLRDTLGVPGPAPEQSESELGYYSQYRDQSITKQSIALLVTANLAAFPNTQLISTLGNPELVRHLFRDSPLLRYRRKPVGIRADGLGVYRPIPTWAEDKYSRYVQTSDPIVHTVAVRYRIAPIVTEWMPQVPPHVTPTDYYIKGLTDVVNDHVSMTASTGFPGQTSGQTMSPEDFKIWARANEFSGYRYAVESDGSPAPVPLGASARIPLRWTNFGPAPLYENWQPEFDIVSATGTVLKTLPGKDLHGLVADQRFDDPRDLPASTSMTEVLTVDGLPRGTYSVRVRVVWREHKPNASHVMNYPPMQLAQPGRAPDGSYPITDFTVD